MPTAINTQDTNNELWQRYQQKKAEVPMLFPTEGAKLLAVSEFELMLAHPESQYIGTNFAQVLKELKTFNQLESIFRNENAVSEKLGQYNNLKIGRHMGLMINVGGLDIRYFVSQWHYMLAVSSESRGKLSHSLQFYDEFGQAINKIFLRDDSQLEQWQALIVTQQQAVDTTEIILTPIIEKPTWSLKQLDADNQQVLQDRWRAMNDVHQFFGILKDLELDRASSYYQAPDNMAVQLQATCMPDFLQAVQAQQCPVMIFVGNTGGIQIQTGTIKTIKHIGDWLNILDKNHNDFTLHLQDKAIDQLWCVKRPTKDGKVTCIEAFDKYGNTIVSFFGQRQEGQPELSEWLAITDNIMKNFGG